LVPLVEGLDDFWTLAIIGLTALAFLVLVWLERRRKK
jgi:hypothetical protein